MKASYYNIGCKLNYTELSAIREEMEKEGFETVEFGEKADAIIINGCAVTSRADADSRKIIRRARRANPDAFIGVVGCYPKINLREALALKSADAILGVGNKFDIVRLAKESVQKARRSEVFADVNDEDADFHFAISADADSRTRISVKIQDGCDYLCSYCAVRVARGKSRSMNFELLKEKLKELDSSEYSEIALTGVNLGDYRDGAKRLIDVVRFIADSNFSYRTRLSSLEPNLIDDEIIEIVSRSENLCDHFHVPLQSGSANILKAMKRRYPPELFEEKILKIKEAIPNCGIGADVIAGFPGETENDFEKTYELIERLPVSYLHVFSYSDRKVAESSKYPNKVDSKTIKRRVKELIALSDRKKESFCRSRVGEILEVVPETYERTENGYIANGLSENYVRTYFKIKSKTNARLSVMAESADKDKLFARLVD